MIQRLLPALVLVLFSLAARGEAPILSACEYDYPPYCLATPEGQADGFSVELLQAASKAMGRDVTFKMGPWSELKDDLAEGRIEALPLVGRTPEREALYDFTVPYLTRHGVLVVREDREDIRTTADLRGRQVAVLQGDNAEEYLRRSNLGAVIIPLPSFEQALQELSAGKYDAVVIQKLLALQLLQKTGIKNLQMAGPPLNDFTQEFCFAVRKGNSKLLALLNEGLALVMADGTFRQLSTKWFSEMEAAGKTLSRIVVGGDSDYPPYEYLDRNGQPAGFNVDLTRAIARHLGLQVDFQLGAWGDIRKKLAAGNINLVQGMFYSVERDQEFNFSPPHTIVQHGIVVRKGSLQPKNMNDLSGKTIVVMKGDVMEDMAIRQGYAQQLVSVVSQEEALRGLSMGQYDAALVAQVPALYWIQKHAWSNLVLSGAPVLSAEYCYATPHNSEELLSHFTEGLAALKASGEYRAIQTQWLAPYEQRGLSLQTVVGYLLMAVVPLLVVIFAGVLWSRSLQRQVALRTRELQQELVERKQAEEEKKALLNTVQQEKNRLSALINGVADEIWYADKDKNITLANPSAQRVFGLSGQEAVNVEEVAKSVEVLRPDGSLRPVAEAPPLRALRGEVLHNQEEIVRTPATGELRHLLVSSTPVKDPSGEIIGSVSVVRDITEIKKAEEKLKQQMTELRQWHELMLGREGRVLELKNEINKLRARLGEKPKYGITDIEG